MSGQCFHGGAFWQSLDSQFRSRHGEKRVINADVLDAWFEPSPRVSEALTEFADWSCRMSPPTHAEGLVEAIENRYGIERGQVLVGAGSSALWFLFASVVLRSSSRVLLIEPSYGEYAHVCEQIVGCSVTRITTDAANRFALNLNEWLSKLQETHYDLAVLINPNNPTGEAFASDALLDALRQVPKSTQVVIDEAYMDFWNPSESLLRVPRLPDNVTIIASFSKRFALSGARVAMLRTSFVTRERLAKWCPPWAVSMPGQIAACAALRDPDYYSERYQETHELRRALRSDLATAGFRILDSCANWLNIEVTDAEAFCQAAADRGLFIRNLGRTAPSLGDRWVRIAVKDEVTNGRIVAIMQEVASSIDLPIPIPV